MLISVTFYQIIVTLKIALKKYGSFHRGLFTTRYNSLTEMIRWLYDASAGGMEPADSGLLRPMSIFTLESLMLADCEQCHYGQCYQLALAKPLLV